MQQPAIDHEEVDSLHDYLCNYLSMWKEPPEIQEVLQDLGMSEDALDLILAQLETERHITPGNTIARRCWEDDAGVGFQGVTWSDSPS